MIGAALAVAASLSVQTAAACSPPLPSYSARPASGAVLPAGPVQLVLMISGYGASSLEGVFAVTDGAGAPVPFSFALVRNGAVISFDATALTDVIVFASRGSNILPLSQVASYTVEDQAPSSPPSAPEVVAEASFCDVCWGGSAACCSRESVLSTPVTISGDGIAAAWVDANGLIAGVLPYGTAHTGSARQWGIWYVPPGEALVSLDVHGRQSPTTAWSAPAAVACGDDALDEGEEHAGGSCRATVGSGTPSPLAGAFMVALVWRVRRRRTLP